MSTSLSSGLSLFGLHPSTLNTTGLLAVSLRACSLCTGCGCVAKVRGSRVARTDVEATSVDPWMKVLRSIIIGFLRSPKQLLLELLTYREGIASMDTLRSVVRLQHCEAVARISLAASSAPASSAASYACSS